MVARTSSGPSGPLLSAHSSIVAVLTAVNLWLGLRYSGLPGLAVASETGVGVCFAGLGLLAWCLRPRSRTGPWLLALGVAVLLTNPYDFRLPADLPGKGLITSVGGLTVWLQYAIAGHVLLGYPSGRLNGRLERILVRAAFTLALAGGVVLLLTLTSDPATCAQWCMHSPVQLVADRQLYVSIRAAVLAGWLVLAVVTLIVLARRLARSSRRQRRVFGFVAAALGLSVVLFAAFTATVAAGGAGTATAAILQYGHHWAGVAALPVPFFAGLMRERLAFASVGTLVARLEHVSAASVETALGQTLRDPHLRVAFPASGGWVDVSGRPYRPPDDGSQTLTRLGEPPIAVLVHDPALAEETHLLQAAGAAARLALDNARLHAELRARLAEVRASRQRIAAATDAERQRLERDLHDGAQQRFLGVGMGLSVLRNRTADHPDRELIDELSRELRAAIGDLRDVANGIRPAVLTDQGLASALADLARRSPAPVTLDVRVPDRLDAIVEATAYYLVSEALQNVAKHAGAATTRVRAVVQAGHLVIEVGDDGPGGASPQRGSGLRGLADRVDAVGGRLHLDSPPGGGTTLRAELPCA
ncbi:sensor histidine kinase [Catellatospora bangladeshensis]|uniref:histidine kinase n=1 Tax=Catellatospora bangladeshensis TaxID=310355 RepID=A0A8J3JNA5_9ACTN|nr:sensor histidine kinase [Catellatospora bangladeshensis]GIF82035.1 hypothetical protein Cba03nite_33840 [Catellatospora bangladeshensis]